MAFVPENELEIALVNAVTDKTSVAEFYRLLLDCELLVLGTIEGHERAREKVSLEPGAKLNLVPGEIAGRKFLPVFSSVARMQAYVREESRYVSVTGRALLETTRGVSVILNPGSEFGKQLSPAEIDHLLTPATLRRKPKIRLGEAEYPTALVEGLVALFETRPNIATAWMIEVTFADRAKEPHPLVGIETGGDMGALMHEIEAVAKRTVPGMVFDVQRVDRKNPLGMADALLQVAPFYQRKRAGIDPSLN